MSSSKKSFKEAVMPASSTMQKSHLAPKSSPKEVSRDMSAIESMIVAINKTTDNISSLQRNHDQREALHDSRYHESQKSFMESQKSFYESQKSVQGIMTNMMERLDDLHRHIESVENKFSPIDSTSKTFSSGNLESPHLDLPQEASKPSPSSVQISQSPLLLSQVGMKPEQDVTKMPNLQDINLDTTLPSDVCFCIYTRLVFLSSVGFGRSENGVYIWKNGSRFKPCALRLLS
jgi:uncharacterized protein YukE